MKYWTNVHTRVENLSPDMGRGIDSRNRVWNWVAKLHRLAGWYDNPMPTWFLAPIAGLKLPTQGFVIKRINHTAQIFQTRPSESSCVRLGCSTLERFPGFAICGFVFFNNKCGFNCKILYAKLFGGLQETDPCKILPRCPFKLTLTLP